MDGTHEGDIDITVCDPFCLKNHFTDFHFYVTIIKLEEPMPGIWTTPTGSWQLAIKK